MRRFAWYCIAGITAFATIGANSPQSGRVGSPAPALHGKLLDGREFNARIAAGRVTIVNFWATWCPPCRAETPNLVAAYTALHARGVDFLGIDTTESAPIVTTFLSARDVPYPTALAGSGAYAAYGIAYIPTTLVVDPGGVIRARWTGSVTPAQLARYVADARARRSTDYVTPVQARIDALLAPARYRFTGTATERAAALARLAATSAVVEKLAERHEHEVDYERTQREQGALQVAGGISLQAHARSTAQTIAALRLLATGLGKVNRWAEAAGADRAALALAPRSAALVAALSRAYYRLHDYGAMIGESRRYTRLAPLDGDGWSTLGLAFERAQQFTRAAPAYTRSLQLLEATARRAPTPDAVADVADTALDAADVEVSLAAEAAARRDFALAESFAQRLSGAGRFAELKRNVNERTQEGVIAAAVARRDAQPVISVVPWTGADLPGSLASTFKYRLIVAAPAQTAVKLQAHGVRRDWVASFCADGLCSPGTVAFTTPQSGVKTYEFALVPPHDGALPGHVAISVNGALAVAVPEPQPARRNR